MAFTNYTVTNHLYTSGANLTVARSVNAAATLLVVTIMRRENSNTSTVTYGGQAMTLVSGSRANNSDGETSEIYFLHSPPTGSNNLIVTPVSTGGDFRVSVADFSGGDTGGTPVGAANTGASGNGTVTINSVPADALIIAGHISEDGGAPTTPTNYTVINNTDEGTWSTGSAYRILSGGAGNHTITWGGGRDDQFAASAAYFQIESADKAVNVNDTVTIEESVTVTRAADDRNINVSEDVAVAEVIGTTQVLNIHAGLFPAVQIVTPP